MIPPLFDLITLYTLLFVAPRFSSSLSLGRIPIFLLYFILNKILWGRENYWVISPPYKFCPSWLMTPYVGAFTPRKLLVCSAVVRPILRFPKKPHLVCFVQRFGCSVIRDGCIVIQFGCNTTYFYSNIIVTNSHNWSSRCLWMSFIFCSRLIICTLIAYSLKRMM
jgi:hypothetical protein